MCFGTERAIFREYDQYILIARLTKYVPDVKFWKSKHFYK